MVEIYRVELKACSRHNYSLLQVVWKHNFTQLHVRVATEFATQLCSLDSVAKLLETHGIDS
jgi:hypothetical protein